MVSPPPRVALVRARLCVCVYALLDFSNSAWYLQKSDSLNQVKELILILFKKVFFIFYDEKKDDDDRGGGYSDQKYVFDLVKKV